jgi:hypothetical protein
MSIGEPLMLKSVLIVLGAFPAWIVYRYVRYMYLPRRRLESFLSDQGVDFVRVRNSPSYGWPGYVVVFDSIEKRNAFRMSPVFEALIREVQIMHRDVKHGAVRFDARMAVCLEPISLQDLSSV